MSHLDTLMKRRLLVFVGPGGVGKTTLAASVAADAARRGRRAAVLTIDPARRLATALGLDGLDDELRPVRVPGDRGGRLSAAMLDTRASYDALISRIAPSEEARDRILDNPVYRAFSRTLARSHAYVAMERLHTVMESGDFDLVVLDTPPLRSALDILDAPSRLVRFLDDGVVRWFVGRVPEESTLDEAASLGGASSAALRILGAVASRELVEEMVIFFRLFASMREGFTHRATAVTELMRHGDTSFVLVASPDPMHLDDARFMRDGLVERGVAPDAVVLNRSFVPEPETALGEVRPVDPVHESAEARCARLYHEDAPEEVRALLEALEALRRRLHARHGLAKHASEELARGLLASPMRVILPELEEEVTSVAQLLRLARLFDGT